ncbi:hypothetical protein VTK26DRAFT_3386 [Humicola hyalothermophila]
MQLTKALKLLVVGLSAISVAEATFLDVNRAAGHDGRGIQRRQEEEDEDDSAADPTTSVPPLPETSDEPEPTTDAPPTPTVSTTPTQTRTTSSQRESTTSSSRSTEPDPTTSTSAPEPTTPPEETKTSPVPTDGPEDSVSISTVTQVTTKTRADGTKETVTTESVVWMTPGLADNGNSNQESGMSPQTRNTVIGVVVGVGGAIILGGLAFVAWRIWGRKKPQEENDVLMDYSSGVEKPDTGGSMGGRTPFQSTLESYHTPTPNTAANF